MSSMHAWWRGEGGERAGLSKNGRRVFASYSVCDSKNSAAGCRWFVMRASTYAHCTYPLVNELKKKKGRGRKECDTGWKNRMCTECEHKHGYGQALCCTLIDTAAAQSYVWDESVGAV